MLLTTCASIIMFFWEQHLWLDEQITKIYSQVIKAWVILMEESSVTVAL